MSFLGEVFWLLDSNPTCAMKNGVPRETKVKIPKCKVLIIKTWSETVQVNVDSLFLLRFLGFFTVIWFHVSLSTTWSCISIVLYTLEVSSCNDWRSVGACVSLFSKSCRFKYHLFELCLMGLFWIAVECAQALFRWFRIASSHAGLPPTFINSSSCSPLMELDKLSSVTSSYTIDLKNPPLNVRGYDYGEHSILLCSIAMWFETCGARGL
jgi:hypothetical protein